MLEFDNAYIKIPSLKLKEDETQALIKCFNENQHNKYTYYSKRGTDTSLEIINKVDNPPTILTRLVNSIPSGYFWDFAFLGNYGSIFPHVDDTRQAVISWPLIYEGTPTTFINSEDTEVITDLYYEDNIPALWNTKFWHKVNKASGFRLFFQIELHQSNNYQYYYDLYKSKKLFI